MHYDLWAILFLSSMASGVALVGLLAVGRAKEPLVLAVGLATIAVNTWVIFGLVDAYGRVEIGLTASLLTAAAAAGGYGLASSLLPLYAPKATEIKSLELGESVDPRTTVLLTARLEPEQYSAAAVASELEAMAQENLPEAAMSIMPFLFAAQKARYRAAGGRSPSVRAASELTERLEAMLDSTRFGPVELVTCNGQDTLDEAVRRAGSRGCAHVIVVGLSIGESYELDRAKSRVDLLRPTAAGMHIAYTPPLWGSETLAREIAERTWISRDHPDHTGVAVIMHGQPESREKTHSAFDIQENSFSNRIRMFLTESGIPEPNVRLCYLDWRDPDVTETIRHLAALGCSRVIVVPACFPFESVNTILDLQVAVRQSRVESHVHTLILSPWGDDEGIAHVIQELVREAEQDLRSEV